MKLIEDTEVLRNKSVPLALCPSHIGLGSNCRLRGESLNTLRTSDANLRFYITTAQDG